MKHISQYSVRLSQAFKKIEELEKKNTRIREELIGLRTSNKQGTSCLTKSASTNEQPHFAQSTKSSSNKHKSRPQNHNRSKCMTGRAVLISGQLHTKKAGVPLHIAPQKTPSCHGPRYISATRASHNREIEIADERLKHKKKQEEIKRRRVSPRLPSPPTSRCNSHVRWNSDTVADFMSSEAYWGWSSNFREKKEDLPLEESPAEVSSGDAEVKSDPPVDLATRSRVDEILGLTSPAPIDSKKGFSYLRRAFHIVQQIVFDVATSPGWQGGGYEEGPHLVRLGRDELLSWMGVNCMPYNGYTTSKICNDLLFVVSLRNALCHPNGNTFRDSTEVERLLRHAQRVTVTLGDEKAAMELREMRETLRSEAKQSLQDIRDMYHLSLQPHHEELAYKFHHLPLFKEVLSLHQRGHWNKSKEEKEFVVIAQAWASQNEISILL